MIVLTITNVRLIHVLIHAHPAISASSPRIAIDYNDRRLYLRTRNNDYPVENSLCDNDVLRLI